MTDSIATTASKREECITQLEQVYESLRSQYAAVTQWVALVATVWAALIAFSFSGGSVKGVMVLVGGLMILMLAYEFSRMGRTSGALAITALGLEDELQINAQMSITTGYLLSFRDRTYIEKLRQISQIRDEHEWSMAMTRTSDYSVYHWSRSKSAIFFGLMGLGQTGLAIILMTSGKWPIW